MFINFNGILVESSQHVLHHSSRLTRYGDGIFESMAMFCSKVKLLPLHAQRLAQGAKVLALELPELLNEQNLAIEVEKLQKANNLIHARIRIFLFRNGGGFYAPEGNNAEFIIESEPIENERYLYNREGLRLGIYTDILKPVNLLSNLKTCNALLYVMAGLYKTKNNLDECIILNERKELCESISNNLFWIKARIIYTPSENSGCILGVMRNYLIHEFKNYGWNIETGEYSKEILMDAEEIFLSGATRGIQWVKAIHFGDKEIVYRNSKSQTFAEIIV